MYVYVLQHGSHEGPGALGTFLESRGVDLVTFDLCGVSNLPARLDETGAVLSVGWPGSIGEEERYPLLREEERLLREAVGLGIPVLGICLGAHVLAKACGAQITKAPVSEIGFARVSLTPEGLGDPLLRGVRNHFDVFQWDENMFAVPEQGVLMAQGESCRNQAFRYGSNAYGLQFHLDVTSDMIKKCLSETPDGDKTMQSWEQETESLKATAHLIYVNFLGIILQSKHLRKTG